MLSSITGPPKEAASQDCLSPWRRNPALAIAAAIATAVLGLAVLAAGAPAALAAGACPNAEIRAQQGSEHLTECRAYERVTDVEKYGSSGSVSGMSPDGSSVQLTSGGGWADTDGQDGLFNFYLSARATDRWTVTAQNLSRATFYTPGRIVDSLEDLSKFLVLATTYDQLLEGSTRFYFKDAEASLWPASPVITRQAGGDQTSEWVAYEGAADDLSSYVFSVDAKLPLLPGQQVGLSGRSIYEIRGADTDSPTLRRVDVDTAGEEIGFACGREVGGNGSSRNAVSSDGSRIFFSGRGAATSQTGCSAANRGPMAIYARSNGTTTTEISASECDRQAPLPACAPPATSGSARTAADSIFRGASDDGEVVWFITNRQLADSDTDETLDLYEYRFNPGAGQPHLTQISAGDGTAGPIGSGALVLNTVRVSHDGRRAYFAAQGKLTTATNFAGEQAMAGANNIYLWERTDAHPDGRLRFVATLPSDTSLWASTDLSRPSALADREGRFWVFTSVEPLTEDDLDNDADIYRFDAEAGEIIRISVGREGYGNNGNTLGISASMRAEDNSLPGNNKLSGVSPDGSRILFATRERLQADDEPDTIDVYQWHNGVVSMVSNGRDAATSFQRYAITPDGSSILFESVLPLVSDDTDTTGDTYMARVNGGFMPNVPEAKTPCAGDGCQGTYPGAPSVPLIGSVSFGGDGNVQSGPDPVSPSVRISRLKAVSGPAARVRVRVPSAGRLAVRGPLVRGLARSASKAGAFRLRVVLTPRARKVLRKRNRLTAKGRVVFRAKGGGSAAKTIAITFKQPNVKRAKGKTGGR